VNIRTASTGVNIRTKAEGSVAYAARFACSDGERLSVAEIPVIGPNLDVTIPGETARKLIDLLRDVKKDVKLAEGTARRYFELPSATVYFLPIVGERPDYELFIPPKWRTRVTVHAVEFQRAINRAAAFAPEGSHPYAVYLKVEPAAGKLMILIRSTSPIDEAEIIYGHRGEMDVVAEGKAAVIPLNCHHLADIVKNVKGDLVLELTKADKPALFRLDNGFVHVLWPMFVESKPTRRKGPSLRERLERQRDPVESKPTRREEPSPRKTLRERLREKDRESLQDTDS